MKRGYYFLALAIALTLLGGGCSWKNANSDTTNGSPLVGGACDYDYYPGQCKITKVEQTTESKRQGTEVGGPGYPGYLVEFSFIPTATDNLNAADYQSDGNSLTLKNSWYMGPRYIADYGIKVGANFTCNFGRIKTGTCTPIIYDFNDIDLTDYFEGQTN